MNAATRLIAEVDPARLQRRLETRYLDELAPDIGAALADGVNWPVLPS